MRYTRYLKRLSPDFYSIIQITRKKDGRKMNTYGLGGGGKEKENQLLFLWRKFFK